MSQCLSVKYEALAPPDWIIDIKVSLGDQVFFEVHAPCVEQQSSQSLHDQRLVNHLRDGLRQVLLARTGIELLEALESLLSGAELVVGSEGFPKCVGRKDVA